MHSTIWAPRDRAASIAFWALAIAGSLLLNSAMFVAVAPGALRWWRAAPDELVLYEPTTSAGEPLSEPLPAMPVGADRPEVAMVPAAAPARLAAVTRSPRSPHQTARPQPYRAVVDRAADRPLFWYDDHHVGFGRFSLRVPGEPSTASHRDPQDPRYVAGP